MKKTEEAVQNAGTKKSKAFSDEERAAMKERAKEVKAESKRKKDAEEDENEVLAKIAELEEPDRSMAQRIHVLIKEHVPELSPKTWYGMPAYAKEGKLICFFQSAQKFKSRYATFGFGDAAKLDDGALWPVYYALTELTTTEEAKILALIKKAIG
jgi:uncharacterized protein YdhG (YjbR/CyaY superfamily)